MEATLITAIVGIMTFGFGVVQWFHSQRSKATAEALAARVDERNHEWERLQGLNQHLQEDYDRMRRERDVYCGREQQAYVLLTWAWQAHMNLLKYLPEYEAPPSIGKDPE